MTTSTGQGLASLPLVMFDTNIIYDFFLGRDPDVILLAQLSRKQVEIRLPEFVLVEFRGSILRELSRKRSELSVVLKLADELDRADHWMSGVDSLRSGGELVGQDITRLNDKLDRFIELLRGLFDVEPHSLDVHFKGDLRFVQGLPPTTPSAGFRTAESSRRSSPSAELTRSMSGRHASS